MEFTTDITEADEDAVMADLMGAEAIVFPEGYPGGDGRLVGRTTVGLGYFNPDAH